MPLSLYFGWGLMLPVILSLLYGIAAHRALAALGYRQKNTVGARLGLHFRLCSCLRYGEWSMYRCRLYTSLPSWASCFSCFEGTTAVLRNSLSSI